MRVKNRNSTLWPKASAFNRAASRTERRDLFTQKQSTDFQPVGSGTMRSHEARITLAALFALMACLLAPLTAHGQSAYPTQPLKCLVPFPPGGLPDSVARIVARRLQERLGQPVVIENRPGANGGIAASALANSQADGYTLMVTDGAILSINPAIYAKLPYNPHYIAPVALLARAPLFLAAHAKVPARTMGEFIAHVRERPGALNFGTPGIGSVHHLLMETIKAELHLNMTHVPFKGTADAVSALLGGHVEAIFAAYPALSGAADGNRIKLLATSGIGRSAQAPNVPSLSEFIPAVDFAPVVGIYVRAGTPPAVIAKIAAEGIAIVEEPDVARQLAVVGVEPLGGGPDDFARALQGEREVVAKAVQFAGLNPQ
jgi:tripartite-type tricarboxylate transporter receptor subunit TctC